MQKYDMITKCDWMNSHHSSVRQGTNPETFVNSYMARPGATEPLLLNNAQDMQVRRQIQNLASQSNKTEIQISKALHKKYGNSWRGFDKNRNSCTDRQLRHNSVRLLKLYNQGHTICKVVLSFNPNCRYLKTQRVMNPDFHMTKNGAAFGQVDQLKLRNSARLALLDYTRQAHYVNPIFVGTLQLDRHNIHFHIIVADDCPLSRSRRLVKSKEQHSNYPLKHREDRGKMDSNNKRTLMHDFDNQLSMVRDYAPVYYQPSLLVHSHHYEVQSIVSRDLNSNVYLQELFASLPRDRKQWYYGNPSPIMKRPNFLMKNYLRTLELNHGKQIGYDNTRNVVYNQARRHATKNYPFIKLYDNGISHMLMTLSNLIYAQLKHSTSPENIHSSVPYVSIQARSVSELRRGVARMYDHQPVQYPYLVMSAYRHNSYQARYANHRRTRDHYRKTLHKMDVQNIDGKVDPAALNTVRVYYATNKRYNTLCMDKYRYLLGIRPSDHTYMQTLMDQRKHLIRRYHLIHQMGHSRVRNNKNQTVIVLPRKLRPVYNRYALDVADFSDHAYDAGMIDAGHVLDARQSYNHPFVKPPKLHTHGAVTKKDFQKIKGIDIDDCSFDFAPGGNRAVSDDTSKEYARSVRKRYHAAKLAKKYIMQHSRQQSAIIIRNVDRLLHLVTLQKKMKRAKKIRKHRYLSVYSPLYTQSSGKEQRNMAMLNTHIARQYLADHLNALSKADENYSTKVERHPKILQAQPDNSNEIEL